jgi:release factor glutamine methyltransferase
MLVLKAMVITILDLLSQIYSRISHITETPTLDAQVLVAHFLDKSRPWVMAHPEALLDDDQYHKVIQGLERLEQGEPLPYVIGHWEFHGLDFHLSPDVLIPRPETEMLVERGINWLHNHPDQRTAIDVGTGSGCIGISLAMSVPDLSVLMTDISPIALNVAQVNANKFDLSGRLTFRSTDLLGIVEHFDLIC